MNDTTGGPIGGVRFKNPILEELKKKEIRTGLSSDCKLDPLIVFAIMSAGREHPCDRCNMDRSICRGYPRL